MKASNQDANADFLLTNKIHLKDDSKLNFVNFCIKCFTGHMCVQYHNKKGWGIKCDTCNFRIACLTGAGSVRVQPKQKCEECKSRLLTAQYKDDCPFPAGQKTRTGCILCDSVLRATVVNFFFK